jgi:hypothetical protein
VSKKVQDKKAADALTGARYQRLGAAFATLANARSVSKAKRLSGYASGADAYRRT